MSVPDPITTAVLQNRLSAIAEEVGEAMLRTSYSQILNTARDFSIGLLDAQCQLVAQADHIPAHVGALPTALRAVVDAFPHPRPGDVYMSNDPYYGGSHLPDLTAFVPVFSDGILIFWSVLRAHQSDIGGATYGAYNPMATEIWQEGVRVPPLRMTDENGQIRPDLVELLVANVRHGSDFRGDLAAMIGAARLAERRIAAVAVEFGRKVLMDSVKAMLDGAERQARAIVSTWKDGVYYGESALDDDGFGRTNITVRATVTVAGDGIIVDLTKSDPQAMGFVNSSYAAMISAATMAFFYLLDPDCQRNSGAFRAMTVKAKRGTVVWPNDGAAVTMGPSHPSNEIIEAIVVALTGACPDRVMGGWGRRMRVALSGRDPRNGRNFIWHMFHARPGGGASIEGNGWQGAGEWHSAGGVKFGSIELAEARFPLLFEQHEFRANSGGAGLHTGGDGGELWLRVETAEEGQANTGGEGVRHGARGINGGEDGLPHYYVLHRPNAEPFVLPSKITGVPLPPGSRLHVLSGGGGGWGERA